MSATRLRQVGLTVIGLAALAACRPARGPQGVPSAGVAADLVRIYQGQARILPGIADRSRIAHKSGRIPDKGDCDAGVLITSAVLSGDKARFTLEPIGLPKIEGQPARHKCSDPPREYAVVITDLDTSGSISAVSDEIDRLLQTPERYLMEHGVSFNLKAATSRGPVADKQLKATPEERMLARTLTTQVQRLLSVAPIRRDDRKSVRYSGEIEFEAVVSTDGRLRDLQLPGSIETYADRVSRALALWRYLPARRGDQPFAYRIGQERTVFNVY
jgi:hypothetical protein